MSREVLLRDYKGTRGLLLSLEPEAPFLSSFPMLLFNVGSFNSPAYETHSTMMLVLCGLQETFDRTFFDLHVVR